MGFQFGNRSQVPFHRRKGKQTVPLRDGRNTNQNYRSTEKFSVQRAKDNEIVVRTARANNFHVDPKRPRRFRSLLDLSGKKAP